MIGGLAVSRLSLGCAPLAGLYDAVSPEQAEATLRAARDAGITYFDTAPHYAVGVSEIKKVGTQVKQGEPLMMIHYNDEAKLEQALNYFKDAYRLAPKRPIPPPLVVERVA